MSEKRFSTDDLVNIFYRADVMCALTDDEIKTVVAKLRTGDELCKVAKKNLEMDRSAYSRIFGKCELPLIKELEKAITDHEA